MSMQSLRKQDESQEVELQKYLNVIYQRLGLNFRRVQNKSKQLLGIDVIIEFDGCEYFIDEKAQLHYLNKGLKTFAFELEFTSQSGVTEGWLFDKKKLTTHYFLVCQLESSSDDLNGLNSFRLISVNRRKLIDFLENRGWGRDYLRVTVPMAMEDEPRYELSQFNPKIRVVRTSHLVEQPLNVVINQDDLIAFGVGKELIPGNLRLDKKAQAELFRSIRSGQTGKQGMT